MWMPGVFHIIVLRNPSALKFSDGELKAGHIVSGPGGKTAKQAQTITLPPPCWYDVLFMKSWVSFTPDVTGHKRFSFCH